MEVRADVGISSISKMGEEVCGDTTQVIRGKDSITMIMSDGLGSGIKASILSILSTRIASRLLKQNIGLEQVFETIAGTLPICQTRGLAYSTLSILKVTNQGQAHLIEYDNPSVIVLREDALLDIKKRKSKIAGKEVYEAFFELRPEDVIMLVSDGVINAGVGGLFKLGLGRDRLLENIFKKGMYNKKPREIASQVISLARACYQDRAGDDSTCAVLKVRNPREIAIITGPPYNQTEDQKIVERFMSFTDCKKIVCGGATSNMVARELNKEIKIDLEYVDSSVPPVGFVEGTELVTEGILTLNKTYEILKNNNQDIEIDIPADYSRLDGANALARLLLTADKIYFLLGTAINPAHKELMQSLQLKPRSQIIGKLINVLRDCGKEVELEVY